MGCLGAFRKQSLGRGNWPLGVGLEISELGHFLPTFYYVTINVFVQLSHSRSCHHASLAWMGCRLTNHDPMLLPPCDCFFLSGYIYVSIIYNAFPYDISIHVYNYFDHIYLHHPSSSSHSCRVPSSGPSSTFMFFFFFFLNDQQFHLGCFVETRVRGCLQEPRYLKVSAPLKKVSSSSGHSSLPTDPLQTVGRSYCVQVATAAVSSGVKQTRHAQNPLF